MDVKPAEENERSRGHGTVEARAAAQAEQRERRPVDERVLVRLGEVVAERRGWCGRGLDNGVARVAARAL